MKKHNGRPDIPSPRPASGRPDPEKPGRPAAGERKIRSTGGRPVPAGRRPGRPVPISNRQCE